METDAQKVIDGDIRGGAKEKASIWGAGVSDKAAGEKTMRMQRKGSVGEG